MPSQPPVFGKATPRQPRKPWQQPAGVRDRRLRGRAGMAQRAAVKREEPFCRQCLKAGKQVATEEVDHIKPLSAGGTNDRSNLQGLCLPCHQAKTREERG